ncbi:hypothetical protein [Natrarchaeobaculum sulfurireducens]|uniref:Cell surface protein n=1 Tax=Natrarchaeobaculum sulfurireducens TaxID=2044521 RepID=A0A346PAK3_9EURY|nr:hypothetical protein [Natrarchaeobaculum sulfurireducens]AXR76548.1 Cell surface protein [Natrarchaeobaculum sulfurireducens]
MDNPTRRRLLEGVSVATLVLAAAGGPVAGRESTAADGTGTIEVSIVETDAPVPAGEFLRVTTELENTGAEDVRLGLELLVGEAEARIERRELTVPAGETRTVRQGFFTYPVPRDDEFPVRVVTDVGTAEITVSVVGASAVPDSSPDDELAVEPGTEVFFEAGAIDPDGVQQTIWWVDGEQESSGVGGPWEAAYYAEAGADYFRYTFDSTGTYDVAAAVLPDDADESFVATWTVDVTAGGNTSPTIDDRTPAQDVLEIARGETYTVEFTTTDPDGDLDRVVWWLTQADTILEITDLEGATDTASLTTDAFCHTCNVQPWVIGSDGTFTADEGWQLLDGDDAPDAGLSVSIRSTNSPVDAGDVLEVIVDLENDGTTYREDELDLIVGYDPERVDTQPVSLDGGESGAATLEFETAAVSQDQSFPVRVVGADDEAEVPVQVLA